MMEFSSSVINVFFLPVEASYVHLQSQNWDIEY